MTAFEAADLTALKTKAEIMLLRTPDQTTLAPLLVIEIAAKRYEQTTQFLCLGGIIHANDDL